MIRAGEEQGGYTGGRVTRPGVQGAGRKEKGPRNEMYSLVDASRNVQGREEVFANVSAGADTKANASGGGGALEVGDLRLVEDGSKRGGTVVSDVVVPETASEGQDGHGEKVGVSTGADTKANTWGRT